MGEEYIYVAITANKNYTRERVINNKMSTGDYLPFFQTLEDRCFLNDIVQSTFERGGKQGRLHYHAMLHVTKQDYLLLSSPNFLQTKGFCYKVVECYNKDGWIDYISKDKSFFSGNYTE